MKSARKEYFLHVAVYGTNCSLMMVLHQTLCSRIVWNRVPVTVWCLTALLKYLGKLCDRISVMAEVFSVIVVILG
jgi:hypothetical protein